MRIVSIFVLAFTLSLSNLVIADSNDKKLDDKKSDTEKFKKTKVKILQNVSTHIEVLNKFKACVETAKAGPELGVCKKKKNSALKSLKKNIKGKRSQQESNKEVENKPVKKTK